MTGPGEPGGVGAYGTAALVLEDGRMFRGRAFGARGRTLGEAVFTTGMTGYQETLTDPSYRRQIVVATAPHIGNTGWVAGGGRADDDNESAAIQVAGFVVRDPSPLPRGRRATGSLPEELAAQRIVGIAEVDTRALTRHLRSRGALRCGIFSAATAAELPTRSAMLAAVAACPPMVGAELTGEVTAATSYRVPAVGRKRFTVVVVDLGVKTNSPRMLAARGIDCHVVPASVTVDDIAALGADGVFLSNGPGDPATAGAQVELTAEILRRRIPLLGICFGHQILGRTLGLATYKLVFGHRGINQPVRDEATGAVLVTAHNHGFAVRAPSDASSSAAPPAGGGTFDTAFGRARVAFTGLNDGVVEGLECLDTPAFSVQFHPEAAAGPHDADYLFDRFVALMSDPGRPALAAPRPASADPTPDIPTADDTEGTAA